MHATGCYTRPQAQASLHIHSLALRPLPACVCSGLEAMLHQRRKLLMYLRRTKFDTYAALILRLGLKDSYAPQVGRGVGGV